MRPLIIDSDAQKRIAKVLAYAESHKFTKNQMVLLSQGYGVVAGDNPEFCCHLEVGFRVVFCIEEQRIGWSKHLSVSVDDPEKVPSIEAVKLIMKEFGIESPLEKGVCHCWMEEGTFKAVNILAPR